ncbi:MAG: beta strand repeat-containing protein, partial [Pirellulales bacterium]
MLDRVATKMLAVFALTTLAFAGRARAAIDTWDNTPGGNWNNAANWTDGTVPAVSDSATFNLAQSYQVTFNADPGVVQALSVSAGGVTFASSGGPRTLSITAGAGSQDIVVSGATTSLTLGTTNNPLHITAGDDLSVQGGATLAVLFGSDLAANDLGSGLNGTLRVDGAGSLVTLGGNATNWIASSATGSLVLQNGSTGNSINADLGIASTLNTGTTGSLSISGGSTLVLGGNLTMASQNATGQSSTLSIQGTNSSLMQGGMSGATIGSAANGTAAISIGTTTSGGSLTTGTGLFTISKTGTVTIGGGANTGTLNLGGDVKIDGGVLTKSSAGSTLDFAPDKTITIQSGGRLTIAGPGAAETNQIFNVSGTNSKIESTGTGGFSIATGAQVNLSAAAALNVAGRIHVANAAG